MRKLNEFGSGVIYDLDMFKHWLWKMLEAKAGEEPPIWFKNLDLTMDAIFSSRNDSDIAIEWRLDDEVEEPYVSICFYDEEHPLKYVINLTGDMLWRENVVHYHVELA